MEPWSRDPLGRFDEHELRTQVLNAARHGSGAGPDLERAPVDLPADVVEQPLVVFDEVFARLEGLCVVGLNLTAHFCCPCVKPGRRVHVELAVP